MIDTSNLTHYNAFYCYGSNIYIHAGINEVPIMNDGGNYIYEDKDCALIIEYDDKEISKGACFLDQINCDGEYNIT